MSLTLAWTRMPAPCWTPFLREVAARGRTVVMTSHDLMRAADLASRFDVLSRGVIAASVQRAEINPNDLLAFYRQSLQEVKA